jgi:(p)ppGpp synthase/HD superfamily hydrolase
MYEKRPHDGMDRWVVSVSSQQTETLLHATEVSFVKTVCSKQWIDGELVQQAIQLIKQYHSGVRLDTGESYTTPASYSRSASLFRLTQDQDTTLAALLHNTIDATSLSLNQIALQFNPVAQRIVDGVARADSRLKSFKRIQLQTYETIRKLLEVKDERVLQVKLADRLHNMCTIEGRASLKKQKEIAEETLQFFVPIAESLGLTEAAEETVF